jgi:hypothetical protein
MLQVMLSHRSKETIERHIVLAFCLQQKPVELLTFCLQQKPVESSSIGKHFVRAPAPSTVTNSHQGPIQAKLAIVPDPHRFFLSLEKLYGTRYQAPILHVKNSLRCQRSCLDRQIYGSLKSSCLLDLAVQLI